MRGTRFDPGNKLHVRYSTFRNTNHDDWLDNHLTCNKLSHQLMIPPLSHPSSPGVCFRKWTLSWRKTLDFQFRPAQESISMPTSSTRLTCWLADFLKPELVVLFGWSLQTDSGGRHVVSLSWGTVFRPHSDILSFLSLCNQSFIFSAFVSDGWHRLRSEQIVCAANCSFL